LRQSGDESEILRVPCHNDPLDRENRRSDAQIHRSGGTVLTTELAVDLSSPVIKIKDPDYAEELLHFTKSPVCQGKTRGRVRTTDHVQATS